MCVGQVHPGKVEGETLEHPDVAPIVDGRCVADPLVHDLMDDWVRFEAVQPVDGERLVLKRETGLERQHDRAVGIEGVRPEDGLVITDGIRSDGQSFGQGRVDVRG